MQKIIAAGYTMRQINFFNIKKYLDIVNIFCFYRKKLNRMRINSM